LLTLRLRSPSGVPGLIDELRDRVLDRTDLPVHGVQIATAHLLGAPLGGTVDAGPAGNPGCFTTDKT